MEQWFVYPNIDPVVFALGPFEVRWYALAYIAGILGAIWYAKILSRKTSLWSNNKPSYSAVQIDDFLIWATLGIIIGGRLGYVLFYDPIYFFANPLDIPKIWMGGMSFHGGMLGVFCAVLLYARMLKASWLSLLDLACASAPIGLFTGRIANFINGELYGRVTDHPIGMVFPAADSFPRHPSQLYEAFLEGLLLFLSLSLSIWLFKALKKPGVIIGLFGIGYGTTRIISELFREADAHIGFINTHFTMGMLLSAPMVIIGTTMFIISVRKKSDRAA